jgi:hypothetical protein
MSARVSSQEILLLAGESGARTALDLHEPLLVTGRFFPGRLRIEAGEQPAHQLHALVLGELEGILKESCGVLGHVRSILRKRGPGESNPSPKLSTKSGQVQRIKPKP